MSNLAWYVLPKNVAENGLRATFLNPDNDFVSSVEVCQTIDTDDWSIMLHGYEGNFLNVAKDIKGMRNALEDAEDLVDWILQRAGIYCPVVFV